MASENRRAVEIADQWVFPSTTNGMTYRQLLVAMAVAAGQEGDLAVDAADRTIRSLAKMENLDPEGE